MSSIVPGSYITHAKLLELGSGEVLSIDKGAIRVRFASGQRTFLTSVVEQHLTVTAAAPAAATKATAGKSKSKAPKKKA